MPTKPSGLSAPAIRDAARQYVADGESLATFLADLEIAHRALGVPPPSAESVKRASLAWSDEILATLNGVACEDPLTGLSTLEHARLHFRALYRLDEPGLPSRVMDQFAVVLVSLLEVDRAPADELTRAFDRALRLATVGELIRAAYDRCVVLAELPHGRVLAVVSADGPESADQLARSLRRRLPISSAPRVLVEPLPATGEHADALLDRLA